MIIWQSILSLTPPCPGIKLAKSLILIDLFNPEAKNPPNGPIMLANNERINICACNLVTERGNHDHDKYYKY